MKSRKNITSKVSLIKVRQNKSKVNFKLIQGSLGFKRTKKYYIKLGNFCIVGLKKSIITY